MLIGIRYGNKNDFRQKIKSSLILQNMKQSEKYEQKGTAYKIPVILKLFLIL